MACPSESLGVGGVIKLNLKSLLKTLKLNESSISAILGGIVVVVVGILIFNYFKDNKGIVPSGSKQNAVENILPQTHTVSKGESLWIIAEKYYGSGYNWVDIAGENNLTNASLIEEGQNLIIPEVEAKIATSTSRETLSENTNTITGATYQVVKGDTLWNIAIRAYGDGYKWVNISKENSLKNPNIIHPGNILTLPR